VPATIVAEVCYIITRYRFGAAAEAAFLRSFARDELVVGNLVDEDLEGMAQLVEQYDSFPLGGSDASVIAIAERRSIARSSPPTADTSRQSARNTSGHSSSCHSQGFESQEGIDPSAYRLQANAPRRSCCLPTDTSYQGLATAPLVYAAGGSSHHE
jgi:hypothetical protein